MSIFEILKSKLRAGTGRDIIKVFSFRIGGIFFNYLAMYLVINWGNIRAWGWINLVISAINILGIIPLFGLHTLILKRFPIHTVENNRLEIWRILQIVILLSFITILFLLPFKDIFVSKVFKTNENISFEIFLAFLILIPIFNINKIILSVFRTNNQISYFGIFNRNNIFYFLLSIVSAFSILFFREIETRTVLMMLLVIPCSIMIPGLYLSLKKLNAFKLEFFLRKRNDNSRSIYLLKESMPLVLSSSLMVIMGWSDTFLIGVFMTPEDVGYYNIIFKISSVATIFLSVVNAVVTPKLSLLYHQDKLKLERFVKKSNRNIFLFTSIVLILIIFLSEDILNLFSSEVLFLKKPLLVLIAGYFINAYCGTIGYLLQMTGYAKIFQKIVAWATILNIGLNILLIPKYGLLGAALSGTISMSLWNLIGLYVVNKKIQINTIFYK